MKTAEEWSQKIDATGSNGSKEFQLATIRAIQLDAVKHGMRLAAKICVDEALKLHAIRWEGYNQCNKAILTAAENLKELP